MLLGENFHPPLTSTPQSLLSVLSSSLHELHTQFHVLARPAFVSDTRYPFRFLSRPSLDACMTIFGFTFSRVPLLFFFSSVWSKHV